MANPHPFATVNHIPLALGILYVSLVQGDLVLVFQRNRPKAAVRRTNAVVRRQLFAGSSR